MELKYEFITKDVGKMAEFNGLTSKPYGRVILDIALHIKAILIDFYLMNYSVSHIGLLGHNWTGK